AVIAPVVAVNDAATVPLSLPVHERLARGAAAAETLRDARRAMPDDPRSYAAARADVGLGAGLPGQRRTPSIGRRCPHGRGEAGGVGSVVKAAGGGDATAWRALVENFSSLIWSIARGHRLGSADAADVFQTVWLRLAEHLSRIENPDHVGAWLATTAKRESLR